MKPDDLQFLTVKDDDGSALPASITAESYDLDGNINWLLLSMPISLGAGQTRHLSFCVDKANTTSETLTIADDKGGIAIASQFLDLTLSSGGGIKLKTGAEGTAAAVLDGHLDMTLQSDCRSTVGGLRPVRFEAGDWEVVEKSPHRARVRLTGKYLAFTPKAIPHVIDPEQRFDVVIDFIINAASPNIHVKWRITDFMRFNCTYLWLERYVLSLPLAQESVLAHGKDTLLVAEHELATAAPFAELVGKGAGIEAFGRWVHLGGLNPPVDGGFGGRNPDIWRCFHYGMSRTFEAVLIPGGTAAQAEAALHPLCAVLPPSYYSQAGALPEPVPAPDFEPLDDLMAKTADYLFEHQWIGTLWWGEWWREWDVLRNQGVEEAMNGNASLAPLYHFWRTGDPRALQCAKRALYFNSDIQLNKQRLDKGPYMRTRRFLLDHQQWFHQRYQRVAGIVITSHVFADKFIRDEAIWAVESFAERYVADDGVPIGIRADGSVQRHTETAMTNFIESCILCWRDSNNPLLLAKAQAMGDWILRLMEENKDDLTKFCSNWNSTRYVMRGLLSLCKYTEDSERFKQAFIKLGQTILTMDEGADDHFVMYQGYFQSVIFQYTHDKEALRKIISIVKRVLLKHAGDGTFPHDQNYQVPPSRWFSIYENNAIVAYIPALLAAAREAGIDWNSIEADRKR